MTTRFRIILLTTTLAFLSWMTCLAQSPESILFVGNSYTYFWNLPQHVTAMATSRETPIITRRSTSGGTNLGQHWRGEKNLRSLTMVKEGDYDAVVLQDFSRQALDAPDSMMIYGQRFNEAIKAAGARTYLYVTWARSWDPYMQQVITEKYTQLAEASGATLVPVGPAWARARQMRPDFPLYDTDQSHPSPLGTYLAACVFYGVFTELSPVGLPERLTTTDHTGEKIYLNILSAEDALFCQKVAADILGLPLSPPAKTNDLEK